MRNKLLSNFLKFLLFLSIGVGILYLLYKNLNTAYQEQCKLDGIPPEECNLIQKVLDDFASANYFWLILVLLAFMVSNISRAIRWNMLLRNVGATPRTANAFWSVMLGYFANLGLPRMGEVVRAGSMARYEKVPLEKVIGTVVVERIVDVLSLLVVVALALALEFDTIWNFLKENARLPFWLVYAMAGMTAAMILIWVLFRKQLQQSTLFQKITHILKGFRDGILSIQKIKNPGDIPLSHSLPFGCFIF